MKFTLKPDEVHLKTQFGSTQSSYIQPNQFFLSDTASARMVCFLINFQVNRTSWRL